MRWKLACFVSICGLMWLYYEYDIKNFAKNVKIHRNNTSSRNHSKTFNHCHPVSHLHQPLPSYNASTLSTSSLILFPIFPLITDNNYNKNINRSRLGNRMLDFLESLQHMLAHPLVSQVHLMYEQDAMPYYIECRIGTHPKLKLVQVESNYIVSKVFQYVHLNYQNQMVMVTNGDIYPGEGFEHLDYDLMKSKRLFYSLSRHGKQETRCKMDPGKCDPKRYYGSHDAYIFIPTEPMPEKALPKLAYKWDSYGLENMLMSVYNETLNYKVLNPCYIIHVYHNHCSGIRHSDRIRYYGKYMRSRPSRQLQ